MFLESAQNMTNQQIDETLLADSYAWFYEAFNRDQATFIEFINQFGGQQINLPVHIYDREKVRQQLQERAQVGPLDVVSESQRVGYSKRWIRMIENGIK